MYRIFLTVCKFPCETNRPQYDAHSITIKLGKYLHISDIYSHILLLIMPDSDHISVAVLDELNESIAFTLTDDLLRAKKVFILTHSFPNFQINFVTDFGFRGGFFEKEIL